MLKSSNRFDKLNEFMSAFAGQKQTKKIIKRDPNLVTRDPTSKNETKPKATHVTPRKGSSSKATTSANLYLQAISNKSKQRS